MIHFHQKYRMEFSKTIGFDDIHLIVVICFVVRLASLIFKRDIMKCSSMEQSMENEKLQPFMVKTWRIIVNIRIVTLIT